MSDNTKKKYRKTAKINEVKEPAIAYGSALLAAFITADNFALIKKAKTGVDTEVFYSLAENVKIPEKTLASVINLSPRTISNYRDQKKNLDANYSEHLLKLINLFHKGEEYLGDIDQFKQWLEKPFWNSEDKPSDFVNTSGGVDFVMDQLERMAQGYPI